MTQLKIESRDLASIHPYELNAKIHTDEQIKRVAKSISEFGWDQPIVVDANGVIIKGHGRRLAAIQLGLTHVPVLVRDDLDADKVKAARLADNRVAIGDLDADLLHQDLATFNSTFLEGIFDEKELEFMMADLAQMNDDAFVFDLDAAIADQNQQTISKLEEADDRAVRIDKALGFKEIQGRDERIVVRFMAAAEGETGLEGADAFIAYCKQLMGAQQA